MKVSQIEALLMPSAISPSSRTNQLSVTNSKIRLRQTLKSVKLWRKSLPDTIPIYIGDNTQGWIILMGEIKKLNMKNVFVTHVNPPNSDNFARGGAGYAETLTILQTLEIFSLENKSFIMKSNARYFIFNWKLIIDRLPKDFDFAAWPSPDLNFLETGFYVAKVEALVKGLPCILETIDETKDIFVEHLYLEHVTQRKEKLTVFQFAPAIYGQRGHTGRKENYSSEAFAIYAIVFMRNCFIHLVRTRLFSKPK
jgi:hypothetical protein